MFAWIAKALRLLSRVDYLEEDARRSLDDIRVLRERTLVLSGDIVTLAGSAANALERHRVSNLRIDDLAKRIATLESAIKLLAEKQKPASKLPKCAPKKRRR